MNQWERTIILSLLAFAFFAAGCKAGTYNLTWQRPTLCSDGTPLSTDEDMRYGVLVNSNRVQTVQTTNATLVLPSGQQSVIQVVAETFVTIIDSAGTNSTANTGSNSIPAIVHETKPPKAVGQPRVQK